MVAPDGSKADAAGLWIEFVLIPQRLEEHLDGLASGAVSSPGYAELITMFLEQAVANHKLSRKEPDTQSGNGAAPPSRAAKTASLLCERAVRVASAGRFTLEEIELVVPRHLQSLLLRASIKFDKDLLHECNFHRWVIHKALAPEATRSSSPAVRVRDPAADIFQDGVSPIDDLDDAVKFLEGVLADRVDRVDRPKKKSGKVAANGVVPDDAPLQEARLCQVLFDVAESHFMRGRIHKAHELFNRCASLADGFDRCPVPQDRLRGFIVACRAVASSGAVHSDQEEHKVLGQEAVFVCERSRVSSKRKIQAVVSDHCNGISEGSPNKKPGQNGAGVEAKQAPNGYKPKQDEKDLVRVLADDVVARQLPWEYCLALERDLTLPASVRSKVAACNVLRLVLEGASCFDSLQHVSEQFETNKEAVQFFMQLVSTVSAKIRAASVDRPPDRAPDRTPDRATDRAPDLLQRLQQFSVYFCCTLEEPICWKLASKQKLVSAEFMSDPRDREAASQSGNRESGRCGLILLDILQGDGNFAASEAAAPSGSSEIVAKAVQLRAFDALDRGRDSNLARQLYDQAKRIHSKSIDSELFLWYLGTGTVDSGDHSTNLPDRAEGYLSCDAVVYIVVRLADEERWSSVLELCSWAQRRQFMEDKEIALAIREAALLAILVPLCLGESPGREGEIVRKFEELTNLGNLPVVSRISSVRVLEVLESLLAGWINRLNDDTTPMVELARYGNLAHIASTAADSKGQSAKGSGDWARLFGSLLRRLLEVSKDSQCDSDSRLDSRGSRLLLGLADLAFVDHSYLDALQLYLEAGAVRSSFYCDRMASMAREFFTPWVVTRMIDACKEIGARVQAAILCQCLPDPDYESAFQILQTNPLIVDQDAALYFDCVWEIPILELLVHMHAKAGDRGRVNTLINLLQQPALNVHNPASIRQAHIAAMEQRFLQRFYAELV